ncbi:MAG TPA: hypothetical protein VHQ20_02465 [Patescibacteria group bacterium]|nr:hypothetical protein [Patescibacteria group bacterium]
MSDFPEDFLSKDLIERFEKEDAEDALESAHCTKCKASVKIPWSHRFCMFCGAENENFDENYEKLRYGSSVNCTISHIEQYDPMQTSTRYCSGCGIKIVAPKPNKPS